MAPATIKKQRSRDVALRTEVIAEKRRSSIQAREADRIAALQWHKEKQAKERQLTSTKYPRRDVVYLKQIFDTYDTDRSGSIEKAELVRALEKEKKDAQRNDGSKKSLEQRQAGRGMVRGNGHHKEGVFLVDFTESMFRAIDENKDGHVEFDELLRLLYPYATESELLTMLSWVSTEEVKVPLAEFELSDEQRKEIRSMFHLYDKDRSGTISPAEFRQAMRRCGLNAAETEAIFAEADEDNNRSIDLEEFTAHMRTTFYEGEKLTSAMLYGPI